MQLRSRLPSRSEILFLEFLIQKASLKFPIDWHIGLHVVELNDGGMGSLHLLPRGVEEGTYRLFGERISECQFKDIDGVDVIASLYLDRTGRLFELDIWKVDFTPLVSRPILQVLK